MKKGVVAIIGTILSCCVAANGCGRGGVNLNQEAQDAAASGESSEHDGHAETQGTEPDEAEEQAGVRQPEPEMETEGAGPQGEDGQASVNLPDGFEALTEQQLEMLPDTDGLGNAVGAAVESIGVQEVVAAVYGNYDAITSSCVYIDTYIVTDQRGLIVNNSYLGDGWDVVHINDAENGNLYYPVTGQDAYDYATGECINPIEETEIAEETPHRDGMYGVSDKDIYDIGSPQTFQRGKLDDDVTGNWRISTINEDIDMVDYALSFYKKLIWNDSEVHGIVNFHDRTTTCITCMSGNLYVTVYEYVDGEEHSAKDLFTGDLIADYIVYTDNGDIEQVQ